MKNMMGFSKNKKLSLLILTGILVLVSAAPVFAAGANLNNDPKDRPTLRVTNYTSNPDCNACWSTTANVNVGEIAAFAVYYHNTGPATAQNLRIRISTSLGGDGQTVNANATVWADNANAVTGSSQIIIPSGKRATSLTHLATIWRPNQTVSGSASLPFGQNGTEVLGSNGLNLGDIAPGWSTQGSLIIRFRVEGTDIGQEPSVDTLSATAIDRESARLRGEVNPRGDSTRVWFEWGTSSSNLNRTTLDQSAGSGNSLIEFSSSLTGLDPDTTYFFRAVAQNSFGTVRGSIRSFTTKRSGDEAPDVTTLSATSIDEASARLRGEVNPRGDSTRVWFEWGRSSSNLNRETSDQSVGSGNSFVDFSASVSGLDPDTTYFYRAVAQNSFGTVTGEIRSFTTERTSPAISRPSVAILPPTGVTANSATIRGQVNPNGSETNVWFEWGINPDNLIGRTTTISAGRGNSFVNVQSFLSLLGAGTTYYYRLVAENSAGRSLSAIESFRTTSLAVTSPPVSPTPSVARQVVRVIERATAPPAEELVKLTLEADKRELRKNKINYTVSYENLTKRTLRDASIEVTLPDELDFVDADRNPDEIRDNNLVFRLGTVGGGERGEITIETEGKNLKSGDRLIVGANLSYLNGNNVRYIINATEITEITKEDLSGGFTAVALGALRDFVTNPVLWLIVAIFILYLLYRFFSQRKGPSGLPPTNGGRGLNGLPPLGND